MIIILLKSTEKFNYFRNVVGKLPLNAIIEFHDAQVPVEQTRIYYCQKYTLTDTSEDSKLVDRRICAKVSTRIPTASERRV